jgi:cytochrome P450
VIRPLVERLLEPIVAAGGGDLSQDFARLLPTRVIAAVLGIPTQDEDLQRQMRSWNDDIMRWSETFGEDPTSLSAGLAAAAGLDALLLPIIRRRKAHPGDDYISRLWTDGPKILQPWTEGEVLAQCRVLLFAGTETTEHGLNNALYVWLTHPEVRSAPTPQQLPHFVDEVLRFYGVIHFRVRVALSDLELGGQHIRAGDRVHPMNSAANRDPSKFEEPDEVRPGRSGQRQHLAFNVGPRTCVGAELARVELIESMAQIMGKMPSARLDAQQRQPQMLGHMPRSFRPLNVVID